VEAAARAAQTIAPSDTSCWLASVDWRLHWLSDPALGPREALPVWKEAEALLDTVLTIRPGSPRGLSAKVHVILGRARAERALGRDPGPDLARAERFLAAAEPFPPFRWLVPLKQELIRRTRKELGKVT
jgi:hypothetical protein